MFASSHRTNVLHCTVLYCTVLYCTDAVDDVTSGSDAEDFEQNCSPNPNPNPKLKPGRLAFQACNYTCQYLLAGLEEDRFQVQILHERDSQYQHLCVCPTPLLPTAAPESLLKSERPQVRVVCKTHTQAANLRALLNTH